MPMTRRDPRQVFLACTAAVLVAVGCSSGAGAGAASSSAEARSASAAARSAPTTAAVTARAATVAVEHRYVAVSEGERGQILLIDLSAGTSASVVAARGASGKPYFLPPFSESADGRKLLVGATGPSARSALYLIDVPTGRVTLLYEDEEIWAVGPLHGVISPDGARYAFHGHDGVRVGDTAGGPTRLFVEDEDPGDMTKIWFPLAWSVDRTAIALAQGTDTVTKVATFRAADAELYWSGTGSHVSWRLRAPYLAVAGAAGTFGGDNRVYAVDPNIGEIRDLEPLAAKTFGSIAWHPTADRLLYTVADSPFVEADAYTRTLSEGAPKRVESPRKIWDAWWSSDGSHIYATAARGTSTGAPRVGDFDVLELPSGRVVASICGTDGRCR